MTPHYLLKPARLAGSSLLATQSDDRLVDLVRAGSEPAFDAIVSRYRGPLLRYCGALLGAGRAEDAVQQALVNAYNAMHRDDKKLILKPWLYRIAHNASLNFLRAGGPQHEPLEDEHATFEQPHEVHERLAEVLAAVQTLPVRQRDAIVLREVEGRSYEEIAAALGTGSGSVRALINRARGSLRMAMTALTPVGLLLRLPSTAEVTAGAAGAGAGAIASKVAATALVTGAVAGGVALAPIGNGGSSPGTPDAPATAAESAGGGATAKSPQGSAASGTTTTSEPGDDHGGRAEDRHRQRDRDRHRGRGEEEDHSGPDDRGDDDGRGPSSNSGPGGGGDETEHATSEPGSSGPGPGDDAVEDSRSGSGGGGPEPEVESGSGSGGSGSGGSDDSGSHGD
jgi:RNA polymerase sigma factor (sigma-70 family)